MNMRLTGFLLLPVFCTGWAGEPIDRSVPAQPDGVLLIENVRGSVLVEGWDRAEVEITGELDSDAERIDVTSENGRVEVRVILDWNRRAGEAELIVKAPRGNRLEVETSSAEITVVDFDGAQRITTTSGEVTSMSSGKELAIKSVSGDIKVSGDGTTTRSVITSMNGELEIMGVSGDVRARSVSGDVILTGQDISQLHVSSTSGDLEIVAGVAPGARVDLTTMSGDAVVQIRGDVSGEFTLKSISGDIDNCFGPEVAEPRYGTGRSVRFTRGDGDAEVRISTMSGDIELCGD